MAEINLLFANENEGNLEGALYVNSNGIVRNYNLNLRTKWKLYLLKFKFYKGRAPNGGQNNWRDK